MGRNSYIGEFEQMVLLAILQGGEEANALQIRQELEGSADRTVSKGAFYTTLDRLETKGLLSSSESAPSPVRGGRARRLFRVEEAGMRALWESRRMLDAMWDGVEPGEPVREARSP